MLVGHIMAKKMKGVKVICLLLLLVLIAIAAPVSAVTLRVDLNKTYQFQSAYLSNITTIDLGNPALSQVSVLSTSGTDIQTIQMPTITTLERIFTLPSATYMGNNVSIAGGTDTTISYLSQPSYQIYLQPTVPTFSVKAPGYTGNPFVLKYNPSSASGTTLSSLLNAVDTRFLYNTNGILYEDPNNETEVGTWNDTSVTTHLPSILNSNTVDLNPFTASASTSHLLYNYMVNNGYPLPGTGKYFAGALSYDNSSNISTVYALSQVVFLNEKTPIVWSDASGPRSLPTTYVKGQGGDVTLSFNGSNHPTPTNISYMLINSTKSYTMTDTIDTQQLAKSAANKWTSIASGNPVLEILDQNMHPEANSAYTYNLTVVGQTIVPGHIITPGYGFINKTNSNQITIPGSELQFTQQWHVRSLPDWRGQ